MFRTSLTCALLGLILLLGLISLSCNLSPASPQTPTLPPPLPEGGSATPTPTTAPPLAPEPTSTPTPVPAAPLPTRATPTAEATAAPPTRGEIEVRFTDPGTQEQGSAHFPFEILQEGEQRRIDGSGVLDCAFSVQQCGDGVCVTYNSSYYWEPKLDGLIYAPTENYPDGSLDANLAGTFTMKQYWTDIPAQTTMPFTAENPFEVSAADVIPLFFHFVEGATVEVGNPSAPDAPPWVFTLHLF